MAIQKKQSTKISLSVKQTFYTSITLDKRLLNYCKDKGIKASSIHIMNLENFLTNNNY